jgi:hypothetical protein
MDVLIQSLVRWCEEQRAVYERQLALLEPKVQLTREYRNGRRIDRTAETAEIARKRIAELDGLILELRQYTRH